MLAQNFKTAADLGISDDEQTALIKVLGMLERGELIDTDQFHPVKTDFGFYMGCQYMEHSCGTLACIGGWAAILMGNVDVGAYVDRYMDSGALHNLYWQYPGDVGVAEAATALRNFLTEGDAMWGGQS